MSLPNQTRGEFVEDVQKRYAAKSAGIEMDRWHRYKRGKKLYTSVTGALGLGPKPWMTPWAEKMQRLSDREACIRVAREVATSNVLGPNTDAFDEMVGRLFDKEQSEAKAARKHRDDAADLGSEIHALIHHELSERMGVKLPDPEVSDRAIELMKPWMEWADEVELLPVLSEFAMVTDEGELGGTADLLAFVKGKLTLVDWKTGAAIYLSSHIQTVGYKTMLCKMGVINPLVPMAGLVVRIPKRVDDTPVCEVSVVDQVHDSERWEMLKSLAGCYRAFGVEKKRWEASRA